MDPVLVNLSAMHVLFVHKNFPAQFGHIAGYLVEREGFQCTFVSEREPGVSRGVRRIQYAIRGGATKQTHYCSRSFENFTWHSHAVYETMKAHPEVRPDLVVGHSGFGSTLFLADLYDCPIINYFEWFYRAHNSEMDFRPERPPKELNVLRARGGWHCWLVQQCCSSDLEALLGKPAVAPCWICTAAWCQRGRRTPLQNGRLTGCFRPRTIEGM